MKRYHHRTDPRVALQILMEMYDSGKTTLNTSNTPTLAECAMAASKGEKLSIIVCIDEEKGTSETHLSFKETGEDDTDMKTIKFLSTFKREKDDAPRKIKEGTVADVIEASEAYLSGKRVRRFNADWPQGWIRLEDGKEKIEEGELKFDVEAGQTTRYMAPTEAMRQKEYNPEKKWLIAED